jgi:hypothetical protein
LADGLQPHSLSAASMVLAGKTCQRRERAAASLAPQLPSQRMFWGNCEMSHQLSGVPLALTDIHPLLLQTVAYVTLDHAPNVINIVGERRSPLDA